jgi:hypothetical protein
MRLKLFCDKISFLRSEGSDGNIARLPVCLRPERRLLGGDPGVLRGVRLGKGIGSITLEELKVVPIRNAS